MRKAGVLFAIISLVGADVVLGQIYTPGGIVANPTTNNASPTLNYVGIGTTTPTERLDVTGAIKASTGLKVGTVFSVSEIGEISGGWGTRGYGYSYSISHGTYSADAGGVGAFVLGQKATSYGLFFGNGGQFVKEYKIFNTTNYALLFGTNNTERMRIDATGKVGIGTTAPVYGLDLNTPATATDAWLFNRARMSELVLGGAGKTNNWLFHRPDDGRTSLYIVPVTQPTANDPEPHPQWGYNWAGGYEFGNDGTLKIKNMTVNNRVDVGGKIYSPADATVKLAVAGTMVAQKVKVTAASNWPDFVFDNNYALQPLAEVEQYVQANKHLPNIPAACELEENGIDTGEMLRLQMIKIEELTLHLIELQKEVVELKKANK